MRFLDWLVDHIKALSIVGLLVVIGWQAYSGMYDWHSITTDDIQANWSSWKGREVTLSNATIKKYELREEGTDTIILLLLANGRTNPPDTVQPLLAVGRMATEDAQSFESLPWCLRNYGTYRLVRADVVVADGLVTLRRYSLPLDASWSSTPYWFTVNTVNRFAPLKASIWSGVLVQALAYAGIVAAVLAGLAIVFPAPE
jgi:hypothetical protein